MLFYLSWSYNGGDRAENITGESIQGAERVADWFNEFGVIDYVVYVGF